jgi:hypothetical protein
MCKTGAYSLVSEPPKYLSNARESASDSIINQTNICDTLKFARWVRHTTTFLTTFMATNYKIRRWEDL